MAWGKTPDVYTLPEIVLDVPAAGWLSGAAVVSWSIDRELVASTIPGNIRERTGLSIGDAQVTVRPTSRATPWSTTPAQRIDTGAPATLCADHPVDGIKALGAWLTDETDGAISGEDVDIELLEASYAGRDLIQRLPAYDQTPFAEETPVDPVWAISRLLERAGFPASPVPDPATTILAVPMDGAIHATQMNPDGAFEVLGEVAGGWSTMGERGLVAGGSGTSVTAIAAGPLPVSDRLRRGGLNAVVFTLDVVGTVYLLDVAQGWLVRVVNDPDTATHTVTASNDLTNYGPARTFAGQQSATWPDRVQVMIQRAWFSPGDGSPGYWANLHALARSGPDAAWSSISTHSANLTPLGGTGVEMPMIIGGAKPSGAPAIPGTPDPGRFASAAVTAGLYDADPGPELWAPPKAVLRPFGWDAGLPFVPEGLDTWAAIQDNASANLGAVIIDLDGIAQVLTKDELADTGGLGATVDVGAEWDDLGWTVDPDDKADRVQVTFTPPVVIESVPGSTTFAPEAWRTDEVVSVAPGEIVTIPATFENRAAVGVFPQFVIPAEPPTEWRSQANTILAFDNPQGTGAELSATLYSADAIQTSATTATIRVRNRHTSAIYLVDGNGDPCLILRARKVATYDTTQAVARGASEEDARHAMDVDLTPWVQSPEHARDICNYLYDRVSGGGLWKASSVRCRLDWSLDIGQVRRIEHPETGLAANVLITKVALDGSAGEIAQTLDLVLLPWTYDDFAAAWPTETYADFATAQGSRTYADFAADPLWTGA